MDHEKEKNKKNRQDAPTITIDSDLLSDLPESFAIDFTVTEKDVETWGYLSDHVLVFWLNKVHLAHTFHLGLNPSEMRQSQIALATSRMGIDFLVPITVNDTLRVGTRISEFQKDALLERRFQVVRIRDSRTIVRAVIKYIGVDAQTGKPSRLPPAFCDVFRRYQSESQAELENGAASDSGSG